MDRVFNQSEIKKMCIELNEIITECEEYADKIKDIAKDVKNAVSKVPGEGRAGDPGGKADIYTTAAENIDFKTITRKITNCEDRVDRIISADASYGNNTDSIKDQVNAIKRVLEGMNDFLGTTSLKTNYKDFMIALETARADWNKSLDEVEQALDQVRANTKGAEEISTLFSSDPVNLSTGNFIFDRTDLQIEGDSPLIFRRFYNSINERSGSLGTDWNHNYEVRLVDAGKEKVLILDEGKEERFLKTSTGVYTSLYHSNGNLEETKEGYLYKTTDQTSYYFDKEGYYLRQEVLNGSVTILHYEESKKGRRLSKIERTTGEAFTLSYTEEEYLYQVTDHSGRTVTYQMQNTRLIGVCTPRGHWYRYGYSRSGKLESIQNARDVVVVENNFDDQMRTTHQKFPDGGSMTYEYDDENRTVTLTERNGSKVTYVHDAHYRDVKHIYSDGEERFEYNKLNQKTLVVDKLGNKTQYGYDEKGNLTRVINALGAVTQLRYDERNQPTDIVVNGNVKIKNRYDENGNLIETADALGNKYQLKYKKSGWPEHIIQPDGSEVWLTYDERGNIVQLTDAAGSVNQYCYDSLNRVVESVDGNGNTTTFAYDADDNIIRVINANGDERTYQYNESNKITAIKDFDGSITRREYNVLNRPSKVTDQLGRETQFTYDAMWNLARITEPNGAKTTYIYNDHNQLGRVRNANGDVTRYTYDANGNRIKMVDEEGNETFFTYDVLGQLTGVAGPEGAHLQYDYDDEGNLTKVTDALMNEVSFTYDAEGNLLTETGTMGETRAYTYTALGEIESITDEGGRVTHHAYEPGGQLSRVTYPDRTTEYFTYDGNGNVSSYSDQRGYQFTYIYDSLDNVVKICGSDGTEKNYSYDSIGNVTTMTDALGHVTKYEYTLTGQLAKVTDPLGNETAYSYDVCDHLIEIRQYGETLGVDADHSAHQTLDEDLQKVRQHNAKDRICHVTSYERDLMGRVISVTDDQSQKEKYTYSPKGELLSKIDQDGYLTKYGYTAYGDVKHIQYADGKEVKLGYNALRHLQEVEDWMGITKIETDANGRTKKVTYPDGKELSYTFGKSGEKTSITYPEGRKVQYGYDQYQRLSELRDGDNVIHYAYDNASYLKEKRFPNGMKTTYDYDEKGLITSLIHSDKEGVLDSYQYGYDASGNKVSIQKSRRGLKEESGNYAYGYDPIGRLKSVEKDGVLQRAYTYDAFGNRTGRQEPGRTTDYTYNSLNQLVKSVDAGNERSYHYDKRGNLSQVTENGRVKKQYVYGALNRLEEAVDKNGNAARYQYNGLGHRVGKQIGNINPEPGIPEQTFHPTKKIDYIIDMTKDYHNLLQKTEDGGTQSYLWDGFAVGVVDDRNESNPWYYLQDELGSPIRLLDSEGVLEEYYGYDEFGQDLYQDQNGQQPFGYTGYQYDPIAGTYYAQAREYQALEGRFAGTDNIKGFTPYPQTFNEYAYCMNSPMCYVDVDGNFLHIVIGAGIGGLVNAAVTVGTSLVTGEKITFKKVATAFVGGAVSGGVTAATGNPVLGAAAGGAAESVANDWGRGTSVKNMVRNAVTKGATDAAFTFVGGKIAEEVGGSKLVSKIKDSKIVKTITDKVQGSSFVKAVDDNDFCYKVYQEFARNKWKKGEVVKLSPDALKMVLKTGLAGAFGKKLLGKPKDLLKKLLGHDKFKNWVKGGLSNLIDEIYLANCIG